MDKLELLQKIKSLAENGVAGEKDNAQKILDNLMRKYNIKDIDLQDDILQMFDFTFKTKIEFRLICQLFYSITGNCNGRASYRYKHHASKGAVKCTKAEFLEFEAKRKFYIHHFNKDMEIFYLAFIQKNNLYPDRNKFKDIEIDTSEFTEEDKKAAMLARMMEEHRYNLQLKEQN